MQITTKFSNGDKAWIFSDGCAQQLTIGQVRVEVTGSPGISTETIFNNYGPQSGYEESYMCVETGIGSGAIYALGKSIFETEAECIQANAERIAAREAEKEAERQYEQKRLLAEEAGLRAKLARIEAIKAA